MRFHRPDPAPRIASLSFVIVILGILALIAFAAGLACLLDPFEGGLPGLAACWSAVAAVAWLMVQFTRAIARLKRGGTLFITLAVVDGMMHVDDAAMEVSPVVVNPCEVTSIEVQRSSDTSFEVQICRPPAGAVTFRFVEHDFRAAMAVRGELRSVLGRADQPLP
jgi:hypothetical protein